MLRTLFLYLLILMSLALARSALADDAAERVNVDTIKEKYWARGDESEIGVVQNRLYSKEHKFEYNIFGGITSTDPFLSVRTLGGSFGFHFSEYLSAHIVSWKQFVSPSAALTTFQDIMGATTNNNPPKWFLGAEGSASFLYGKLSLIGKAIIYYDMHVSLGGGRMTTDNGAYAAPMAGIGQQVYIHRNVAIRVDYRALAYNEAIIEKVIPTKLGNVLDHRWNWNHTITFGITYLWSFPTGSKSENGGAAR